MTMTDSMVSGYALDPAWHAERARLGGLTHLYDPTTMRLCEQLGVASGWRCLDVGAGTGTVAELLAERVGPTGHVVALDTDTRFLDPIAAPNLEVWRADVTADPLPEAHFDLVHARLLLEHLPARRELLSTLAGALRPGGVLLIEDFDWVTAGVIDPPNPTHDAVALACRTFLLGRGYDPYFGRALPRLMRESGLAGVGTHAVAEQVRAHREFGLPQWELLVDQLEPGLLAAGLVTREELAAFHELWHDGGTVCFAPVMVSCWGWRPV
jgi:SAM-dependent methyltransferase